MVSRHPLQCAGQREARRSIDLSDSNHRCDVLRGRHIDDESGCRAAPLGHLDGLPAAKPAEPSNRASVG
jgi:hypothetical protein